MSMGSYVHTEMLAWCDLKYCSQK
uniref:Uncharacterized protein n=1 Tax=Anguilla anguilla TaxID=7936 RepID=A0A0E9V2E7_ANGAN